MDELPDVQDAPDSAGRAFISAVRSHDAVTINHLMTRAYPSALWGKYLKQLSPEDRNWVMSLEVG